MTRTRQPRKSPPKKAPRKPIKKGSQGKKMPNTVSTPSPSKSETDAPSDALTRASPVKAASSPSPHSPPSPLSPFSPSSTHRLSPVSTNDSQTPHSSPCRRLFNVDDPLLSPSPRPHSATAGQDDTSLSPAQSTIAATHADGAEAVPHTATKTSRKTLLPTPSIAQPPIGATHTDTLTNAPTLTHPLSTPQPTTCSTHNSTHHKSYQHTVTEPNTDTTLRKPPITTPTKEQMHTAATPTDTPISPGSTPQQTTRNTHSSTHSKTHQHSSPTHVHSTDQQTNHRTHNNAHHTSSEFPLFITEDLSGGGQGLLQFAPAFDRLVVVAGTRHIRVRQLSKGRWLVDCPTLMSRTHIQDYIKKNNNKIEHIPCTTHIPTPRVVGVITGIPLGQEALDKIQKSLPPHIEAERIKKWSNKTLIDTTAVRLTFNNTHILPSHITVQHTFFTLTPFKPQPSICGKCWRIGHSSGSCRARTPRCGKCAIVGHSTSTCTSTTQKCTNCGGNHSAAYRGCGMVKLHQRAEEIRNSHYMNFQKAMSLAKSEGQPPQTCAPGTTPRKTLLHNPEPNKPPRLISPPSPHPNSYPSISVTLGPPQHSSITPHPVSNTTKPSAHMHSTRQHQQQAQHPHTVPHFELRDVERQFLRDRRDWRVGLTWLGNRFVAETLRQFAIAAETSDLSGLASYLFNVACDFMGKPRITFTPDSHVLDIIHFFTHTF